MLQNNSNDSYGDRNESTIIITNQDIISDHMNADSIEKTFTARRADQRHENKISSNFTSNQSQKHITTIPANDGKHRNNRVIYSLIIMNIKNGNQDQHHKR